MKAKSMILFICLLASLCACTQRSTPAMVYQEADSQTASESVQEAGLEDTAVNPKMDLSPLTQSSLGQAIVGSIREVESVVVTVTADGELVYESADDVLAQGFYDALQVVNETFETLDIRPIDYEVDFTTALGITKHYGIWINFSIDNNVIVQCDDALWDLPITESNWIRARISGLA